MVSIPTEIIEKYGRVLWHKNTLGFTPEQKINRFIEFNTLNIKFNFWVDKNRLNITCNICKYTTITWLSRLIKGKVSCLCDKHKQWNKEKIIHAIKFRSSYKLIDENIVLDGYKTKLRIKCLICDNEFDTNVNLFLNEKCGCRKCGISSSAKKRTLSLEKIKEKLILQERMYLFSFLADDNYEIKNNKSKIRLICNLCKKEFTTSIGSLIDGKTGCNFCRKSKGELFVARILEKMNIKFNEQVRFKECKRIFPLVFDFHCYENNVLIEYNGEQHYNRRSRFNKTKHNFEIQFERDKIKQKYCLENNINLIIIDGRFYKTESKIYEYLRKCF